MTSPYDFLRLHYPCLALCAAGFGTLRRIGEAADRHDPPRGDRPLHTRHLGAWRGASRGIVTHPASGTAPVVWPDIGVVCLLPLHNVY